MPKKTSTEVEPIVFGDVQPSVRFETDDRQSKPVTDAHGRGKDRRMQNLRMWRPIIGCWIMVTSVVGWAAEGQEDAELGEETATVYEEVVVVAQKRPEPLQSVPLSVSVVDRDTRHDAGIDSVKQTSGIIPNLFVSGFSARGTSYPYVRGIGAGIGEPAVTTYVDGVPQLSASTTDVELLDVDRIEFLRGPQGALYGRNTLGGVIHYISRKPSADWSFDLETQWADAGYQKHLFTGGGPIREDLATFRVGGSMGQRDGFTTNELTGTPVDTRDTRFLKAQIRLTPKPNWTIDINGYTQRDRDGGFCLYDLEQVRRQPHRLLHDFEGENDRNVTAASVAMEGSIGPVHIVSISAYEAWDMRALTDLDFSPMEWMQRRNDESQHQFYQELRARSADAGHADRTQGNWSWMAGVSYFDSRFDHDSATDFLPELTGIGMSLSDTAVYRLDDYGFGLFGETTWRATDRTDVIFALRYAREVKKTDAAVAAQTIPPPLENQTLAAFEKDDDDWLPRVGITHRFSPQLTAYATTAKGYRAGGYNRNLAPGGPYEYDQESNWTTETGIKTHWLSHRIVANMAAFYIEWKDRQLELPHAMIPGRYYLDNVGEAVSQGIELEFQGHVSQWLTLFGAAGFADATFEDYIDPNTGNDVSGLQLPYAPDLTWHLGGQYERGIRDDVQGFLRMEWIGFGKMVFDNANTVAQDSFAMLNVKTGLRWRGLSLEAWVHNATDEEVILMAIPSMFAPSGYVGRNGEPRWAGVSLRYRL